MTDTTDTHAFTRAYQALNEQQRVAVDAIEGPVMVVAGPGTGKTQILALRIANILKQTDAAPGSVLCLTFTESGAASMRARLVSLIGEAGYRVPIYTFHGFCNELIRRYPEAVPEVIGRAPLIDLDAVRIVRGVLDALRPSLLYPHGRPYFYVSSVLGAIKDAKSEYLSPEALRERIATERAKIEAADDLYHEKGAHAGKMKGVYVKALRDLDRATQFCDVYRAYQDALMDAGYYDFSDTIYSVIAALETDADFKLMVQEEYQYILADEHQDANGSQNKLLSLLADFHSSPNLFVVGDEKQAIFRFQGASLANFLGFREAYPDARIISLTENYRSTQAILDAAHALIEPADSGDIVREMLQSRTGGDVHDPELLRMPSAADEQESVAERIADRIASGTPAHEIAVLLRRNQDVRTFAAALERRNIPHVAYGGNPVLAHPAVRYLLQYLNAVVHFGDDAALAPVLLGPLSGIDMLDAYRLTARPSRSPGALYARVRGADVHRELGIGDTDACRAFSVALERAAAHARDLPCRRALELILAESGCTRYASGRTDAFTALGAVRAFMRLAENILEAHPEYTLADVLVACEQMQEYRIGISQSAAVPEGHVRLMTAHRAKGMEFDHVFVPMLTDSIWGCSSKSSYIRLPIGGESSGAEDDDERRLLYVACTRARITLTLSYAAENAEGREEIPSRFLSSVNDLAVVDVPAQEQLSLDEPPTRDALFADSEAAYLRERFAEQPLSVTALNNFLDEPWKYFFMNLLRVPTPRPPHLVYGSAIDAALKYYSDERAAGNTPDIEAVVTEAARVLAASPLAEADREMYATRARETLAAYIAARADVWHTEAESAVKVTVPYETGIAELPRMTLTGEFDRVEHLGDGRVRVVDFKTGKRKTRNEIEGKTKNANGAFKRQLAFYALLIQLDTGKDWQLTESVLDFVEPDPKKNTPHAEAFSITAADIAAVKTELDTMIRAVYELSFADSACDADAWSTEGCALVAALKERRA